MKTIHFKNGSSKEVDQEVIDLICEAIETKAKFIMIKNNDKVNCYVFNLREINYIS